MGGAGAARAWSKRGMVTNDYQHPTAKGANVIGDSLAAGLIEIERATTVSTSN
jgi:lysophospholipase L1-like esterase